jgi:DNA-binding MltR family transcriptional regulator
VSTKRRKKCEKLDHIPNLTDAFGDKHKLLFAEGSEEQRGRAIVARSFFEVLMGRFLKAFLLESSTSEELLYGDRPLATFSAKISLCFTLGLISARERDSLNLIRKISNFLAHDLHANFQDSKISDWVSSIDVVDWDTFRNGNQPAVKNLDQMYLGYDNYEKFRFQCVMLANLLTYRLDTIYDHKIGGRDGKEGLICDK